LSDAPSALSKDIFTLESDINEVIKRKGGWTKTIEEFFKEQVGSAASRRFLPSSEERTQRLRMSNIGHPCTRKLWYDLNTTYTTEFSPSTELKFLFGDMLEALVVSLVKASGHDIKYLQGQVEVEGIKGSMDCIIDGMVIDVKSASSQSFLKFKNHNLEEDDPFGYLTQLTGYVTGASELGLTEYKRSGGFLAIDKQFGHIVLDIYDLSKRVDGLTERIRSVKSDTSGPTPPPRAFEDQEAGKSGNRKLGTQCSYCQHKKTCWPGLQEFAYSRGPVFLTTVVKEPLLKEKDAS
jgi:hypothetical protein